MLSVATMILCGRRHRVAVWTGSCPCGRGRGRHRWPSSRSTRPARWGLPRDLANLLALGTLGVLYLEYKVDRQPVDPLPGPLAGLSPADQVLPAQDGRGRLVPLPARADAGPDRRGHQPERHGRAPGCSSGRCWPSGCWACSSSSARRAGFETEATVGQRCRPRPAQRRPLSRAVRRALTSRPTLRVLALTLALGG